MEHVFLERVNDTYRIACVDWKLIFASENPGKLGNVYECSLTEPTPEDDAQIFYALAPMIKADFEPWMDYTRPCHLNTWNIGIVNNNTPNIFQAIRPLTVEDRIQLYQTQHDISPTEKFTSTSKSIFSLVAFSEHQIWKTGILQRCIDRLVQLPYRQKPQVYALMDELYGKIIRAKLERQNLKDHFIPKLLPALGLSSSVDNTVIPEIPETVSEILHHTGSTESLVEKLSTIIFQWSGSNFSSCPDGYKITPDPRVLEGLSYMQETLPLPEVLELLQPF